MTAEPITEPRQDDRLPLPPAALLALAELARAIAKDREGERGYALAVAEHLIGKRLGPGQKCALSRLPPMTVAVALGALAAERLRGGR